MFKVRGRVRVLAESAHEGRGDTVKHHSQVALPAGGAARQLSQPASSGVEVRLH